MITTKMLENEIKTLQKAAKIHAKYSISQYKKVLKTLEELEERKNSLEEEVKLRTIHLEKEIQQKEKLASTLENIAKYDQLTSLANRYLFLDELNILQKEANLLDTSFSLLFIDLDGFKLVNDTYGHEIGDALLQIVSRRIKSCIRKSDLVARLGGDEFTVILREDNKDRISTIAKNIISKIKEMIIIDNINVFVGASIGIYTYHKGDDTQDILSKSDIAMYEAKKAGKGMYVFFDDTMQQQLQEIAFLKTKIKDALKNNEFVNFLQPIVLSIDKKIKGAEVLLRLKENNKFLSPVKFIPILEDDIHLIKEVTFWQIKEIVKLMKKTDIFYSINISAKLLNDYDIIDFLNECLEKNSCDTSRIFFEVTETALSKNILTASKILKQIKKMGFNISLDDFGTGYSSLAYLRNLPFDVLKIDKTFIDDILESNKDRKLLDSIVNIADIFDMKIVLEGIETKNQLQLLPKRENIKYQGFYFYKPMPIDEFFNANGNVNG